MSRMNSFDHAFTGQQGSILIGGLVLVLVITIIGLGLFQGSLVESRQINRTETDIRAFYAADAGIHRVALDLADPDAANPVGGLTFNGVKGALPNDNTTLVALVGYGSTCYGGATCDSSVKPYKPGYLVQAKNDTANADRFWLISTACVPGPASNPCPAGSKMAQVQAEILKTVAFVPGGPPPPGPTFQWAAFGGNSLGISGGTVIDSYDSHKTGCTVPCAYGGTNVGTKGNLGSNGSIDTSGTTTVKGDIVNTTNVAADPSDVNIGSNTQVQGNVKTGGTVLIGSLTNPNGQVGGNGTDTTSQVTGTVLHDTASPQVVMAPLPNCGPPYTDLTGKIFEYTDNTFTTLVDANKISWTYGNKTGCYDCGVSGSKAGQLAAASGAFIGFAPGSYCLGDVSFSGNTLVQVTGRTILTMDGQFTLSGGGFVNTTQLAQNLQIISTYGNDDKETHTGVTLSGGSGTYATVYAPTTSVVISGGGSLYGGVMSNQVTFSGGSGVHFDEYLLTGNANLVDGNPGQPGTIAINSFLLLNWKRVECGPITFSC